MMMRARRTLHGYFLKNRIRIFFRLARPGGTRRSPDRASARKIEDLMGDVELWAEQRREVGDAGDGSADSRQRDGRGAAVPGDHAVAGGALGAEAGVDQVLDVAARAIEDMGE